MRLFGCLLDGPRPYRNLASILAGVLLSWWIYVPLHELLHAAGCRLGGGEVSRLEIQQQYGGDLLAAVFPFVVSNSEYAGRLSGFDTGGSDWTYALTVAFPFLLVFPGLMLVRASFKRTRRFLFGAALLLTLSPFTSLTGDFLELGGLVLFQLWPGLDGIHRDLISDDLFRLLGEMDLRSFSKLLFVGFSQVLGTFLAIATVGVGAYVFLDSNSQPLESDRPL